MTPQGEDERLMQHALQLALRGLTTTDPNPRVGCVLARDGLIIAEGWHERAGEAHAEVMALRQAGAAAQGATAYVTLEPCAHSGRTPPCTQALISAQVKRVVYACDDPNPRVNGAGAAALRAAGIEVESGVLASAAGALNPGFFKRMQQGLPWVRVKLGASLDGRTALADGSSRWITGREARQDAQTYRARSSAVLTGSGTALVDDPALNVRIDGATRQPLRVLLDSELRVPATSRMFDREGPALVFTACADKERLAAFQGRDVRIEQIARAAGGGLDLRAVLRRLAELEMNEVWVEAGERLSGALLQARLVDEMIVYVAPVLLGATARPLAQLPSPPELTQALRLRFAECVRIGEDLRLTAVPGEE